MLLMHAWGIILMCSMVLAQGVVPWCMVIAWQKWFGGSFK